MDAKAVFQKVTFGGPPPPKTAAVRELSSLLGRRVRLSLILLGLLAPKAFGVGYHALSLPEVLRARVWEGKLKMENWGSEI